MTTMTDGEAQILATNAIHAKPCPGCGLEPEVRVYYRDVKTKIRRGFHCTCGAIVVDGMMLGSSPV